MIERGVVLKTWGKRGYVWLAHNLAFTIKYHCPGMHITLFHDDSFERELMDWQKTIFDSTIPIPFENMYHHGRVDPAHIKISMYDSLPYQYNLVIDVDAIALHDVNKIFDELIADGGHYYAHIIGEHRLEQGREIPHMYWAFADDIWSHYNLPPDAVLPSTNSSFQFIKKCDESKKLFDQICTNYDNPIPIAKLRNQWGNSQPDELYLNIALAQLKMMPRTPRPYMWMANEPLKNTLTWIEENYPLLCLFGNNEQVRTMYTDWYDRLLIKQMRTQGKSHILKWHKIKGDKHANIKRSQVHESVYRDDILIPSKLPGKIHLVVPFYRDANKDRNKELLTVLKNNLACKLIDRITLVCENNPSDAITAMVELGVAPVVKEGETGMIFLPNDSKIQCIGRTAEGRQTFADVVRFANEFADDDTISIVANTDIYFDDRGLSIIKAANLKDTAFALSRYNVRTDGELQHFDYAWSQDVWAWLGNVNTDEMNLDFPFGKPYCDSRFSFELSRVRKNIINPSYSIRTYHLHRVASRNYTEADRLKGEGIPVQCDTAHRYMKKRMLFVQPGKVGDIVLCLPIVRHYSREYSVDWHCPKQYHSMFDSIDYARPVELPIGTYDKTLDIAFGLGGAPQHFWEQNRHKYDSFVTLKYELAGVAITEKTNLVWTRNHDRETALFNKVTESFGGQPYVLVHSSSDYGSPINVDKPNVVEFKPVDDFTIFDWYLVIIGASQIHCIDSSLCNFIDAIHDARDIEKFYHKTDKVPQKYDETILTNNWNRI